jgi:hypothetical protein
MAIHKLLLEDFDEIDYALIAIHTSLVDYRLAYFLNQKLPILLSKNSEEIQTTHKSADVFFSRFSFESLENDSSWHLIQNQNEVTFQEESQSQSLFGDTSLEVTSKVYLLPELKKIDYLLKIENPIISLDLITEWIHSIEQVSAVYVVDSSQIKSKNNLIF